MDSRLKQTAVHVVLVIGALVSLFPFYWMLVMATNTTADIFNYPPKLTLGSQFLVNLRHVFDNVNFFRALLNTLMIAVITTVLVLFFDSLAAFVFAKFDFPGKKPLFVILLATFLVPAQLSVVPSFVVMAHLGWVGSFKALIVPAMVNAFGIFWMRQYADGALPNELLEAGRVDGCRFIRLYWNIALPTLRPALAFLGIFTFIGVWNDYLWPLVILTNHDKQTVQVALSQLNSVYSTDYSMVMAGTFVAAIPLIVIFVLGARHFIADLTAGAIKS